MPPGIWRARAVNGREELACLWELRLPGPGPSPRGWQESLEAIQGGCVYGVSTYHHVQ